MLLCYLTSSRMTKLKSYIIDFVIGDFFLTCWTFLTSYSFRTRGGSQGQKIMPSLYERSPYRGVIAFYRTSKFSRVQSLSHFYPAEFTQDGVLSSAYSYVRPYVHTSVRPYVRPSQKFLISNDIFGFLAPSHQ